MTSHRWRVEGVLFVFSCFFSVSAREEKFSSNSAPGHAGDMEVAVLEKKNIFLVEIRLQTPQRLQTKKKLETDQSI